MNNISWRAIRAFIAVAEHRSFTAAADHTGYSKATLSQQVSELESALDVQLLLRTTRKLRLTEVGEGYYQRCKQAMQQLDSAADWATHSREKIKGKIRINAVGGIIGEEIIAPLTIEFQKTHPDVQIQLDFSSIRVDLIEDRYDLVIRMGELPDSTLIVRKLLNIKTRYVACPDFIKVQGQILKPMDLTKVPLIYGSVDQWVLTRGKTRHKIEVEQGIKLVSGRAMRLAALAGLGVTRLADIYVQADIKQGKLQEILPGWSESTQLSMVCPPLRHQLARVRSLMQWLKDQFSKEYEQLLEKGSAENG
ncbi:LysR family transcriptional regulator [Microbulbifer variabilis]|uniref:LysR family transcriptional regulator n=1 Tax=Microbulbifer variabilis TaxID=266805 RepID=UPI001CFE3ACF|nr:LysR family transcriptional regulator [Microbulbifer variabilis]